MIWFEDHLYTVCNGDWTIYRVDDDSGETITYVFGVKNGHSLLMESTDDGFDIWIPDPDSETLWKVNQDRLAPESVLSGLKAPWGYRPYRGCLPAGIRHQSKRNHSNIRVGRGDCDRD